MRRIRPITSAPDAVPDPELLPAELLRVPGFISEVMDHCQVGILYGE
jgi:hypothetical protein